MRKSREQLKSCDGDRAIQELEGLQPILVFPAGL